MLNLRLKKALSSAQTYPEYNKGNILKRATKVGV